MNLLPKPYRPTVGYRCGPQSRITTALDRLAFRASDWIGDWIERLTPPAAIELGNILVERYVPRCAAHRAHFIAPTATVPTAIAEPAPTQAPVALPEPSVAPIVEPKPERMEPKPLIVLTPGPSPRQSRHFVTPKPDPAPIAVDWPITHKYIGVALGPWFAFGLTAGNFIYNSVKGLMI